MWLLHLRGLYIALVQSVKRPCVHSGEIEELLRRYVFNRSLDCARDDRLSFRAERSGVEKSIDFFIRLPLASHLHYDAFVKTLYVYIMGSNSGTLYIGVTSNIKRRVYEHKGHLLPGFTEKYNVDKLLYVETIGDPASAINREKQIKKWRREKKVKLIDSVNPQWNDLSEDWYD